MAMAARARKEAGERQALKIQIDTSVGTEAKVPREEVSLLLYAMF
jgi:hypothetical protein